MIDFLREGPRATTFVAAPVAGPALPAPIIAACAGALTPVLLRADGALAALEANDVLGNGSKRIKVLDGKPVFENGKPVFIPAFEGGVKLGSLVDACLYFGTQPPRLVEPPAALYDAAEYGLEVQRRRATLIKTALAPPDRARADEEQRS